MTRGRRSWIRRSWIRRSWIRRGSPIWRASFSLLLVLVIAGSLTPPSDTQARLLPIPDWVQHAIGYGLLTATLLASQVAPRPWWSALSLLALGAGLEVVQGLIGYRFAEAKDLLANAVGIALVALTFAWLRHRRQRDRIRSGSVPSIP